MKQSDNRQALAEIRRQNLLLLVELYGSMAKLNSALGRKRYDSALSQIKYSSFNKTKQTKRNMGVALAREIEDSLNLPRNWMDEEHEYAYPADAFTGRLTCKESENLQKNPDKDAGEQPPLNKISLYELKRREDGNLAPKLAGYFDVSSPLIKKLFNDPPGGSVEAYYVSESSPDDVIKRDSIVFFDRTVTSFRKDGVYLLEFNKNVVIRKIVVSVKGGFNVIIDATHSEHLDDLSEVAVLGLCVGGWESKTFR